MNSLFILRMHAYSVHSERGYHTSYVPPQLWGSDLESTATLEDPVLSASKGQLTGQSPDFAVQLLNFRFLQMG